MDIKESKEVLVAMNQVSLLLIKHFKDGFQVKDVIDIVSDVLNNEDLKKALVNAGEKISLVPEEMKDLSAAEVIELVIMEAQAVPEIIAALKA